jgi:hypothetical protein
MKIRVPYTPADQGEEMQMLVHGIFNAENSSHQPDESQRSQFIDRS